MDQSDIEPRSEALITNAMNEAAQNAPVGSAERPRVDVDRRDYAIRAAKNELGLFNQATQSARTEDSGWLSGLSKRLKGEQAE